MRPVTTLIAVILLAIGVLGFLLPSPLFGSIEASTSHNLLCIVSGVLGLLAVPQGKLMSRLYLIVLGAVLLMLAILTFLFGSPILGVIVVNYANAMLYLLIAILALIIGFAG